MNKYQITEVDSPVILEVCESLNEAREVVKSFKGGQYVIETITN